MPYLIQSDRQPTGTSFLDYLKIKQASMKLMDTAVTVVDNVVSKVTGVAPFGKFERITAGFCMAIPFYLLIADLDTGDRRLWLLIFPVAITLFPLWIPALVRLVSNRKNHGIVITTTGGMLLFVLYQLFSKVFTIENKGSISAYVTMDDAHIFGMLLAIAAMLFMASGVVYWNKKNFFSEGSWRSLLNIVLGLLLMGVIIFPCDTMYHVHMFFAISFFIGCAVGSVRREAKPEKRVQHWIVDFAPVVVMAFAMLSHFGQEWGWFNRWPFTLFNLFGAESIALWITGLDFILVSLKREIKQEGNTQEMAKQQPHHHAK